MIYHCLAPSLGREGGAKNYVKSLLDHLQPGISNQVLTSVKNIPQNQFDLLHLHGAELLAEIQSDWPVVYTLHNHNTYCPSGTKYLTASKSCCDRKMSEIGCTWGHLVDGCGSRRPQNIIKNLHRSHWELETLKKLKIPIIANSDYVRRWLIKNNLPPDRVVTLRCAVSRAETTIDPLTRSIHQQQRILFVGRIVPEKGLDWLLRALALTTDRNIYLDIAGEGWDRPRIEQLAKALKVQERVTWHGWCDSQKLDLLYQQCFSVIFPSVWPEPAGLITLEAYARYRPVIASAVGGIPEHIRSGETGILVPANNIKQLAVAIDELAHNYPKTRWMGEQGHALFLEEFTMGIHIEKLQKIYEQYIAQ